LGARNLSDHIDGPRTTADPSIDLSDLFAFTSPADPKRTVLIADAFPFAGETSLFSNAVIYSLVMRRARVAGLGRNAAFRTGGPEIRFAFEFEVLRPSPTGERLPQSGACKLPNGETLAIIVGDEKGVSTPDGAFRVFAGLRSDPFFIGWRPGRELISIPNFLEEDNCLSFAVEFETARVLNPAAGSLFGVIAEITPRDPKSQAMMPPRYDWVGKPEQTNFRLNGVPDAPDVRDAWNQETPFAISAEMLPVFRKRLIDSFRIWDGRDGKVDWDPAALAANVNVFLEDYLLIDVARPTTDLSHLEIERSTVEGRAYATGGGRTVNANVIDILVTWLVNRDRGPFMQSATKATQSGGTGFPYVRPPNTKLLNVTKSIDVAAPPQEVWALIGQFGAAWHPLVADLHTTGSGVGELRTIDTIDGKTIVEQLADLNESDLTLKYTLISGIPATRYEGVMDVRAKGAGATVTWTVNYRPEGQGELIVHTIVSTLLGTGLDALKARFGPLP
jgi:Polyketide cyclase / dehydrase and lipid transport/Domain of unknown function (DUF4331)